MNEAGNHFHRILKVRRHQNGGISRTLQHGIVGGIKLAEIFSIKNRLNPLIQLAKPPNLLSGFIGGIIVDKKNFVLILRKLLLKAEPESIGQGNYIFLFVITGNNDTNGFFQKKPLSKMPVLLRGIF